MNDGYILIKQCNSKSRQSFSCKKFKPIDQFNKGQALCKECLKQYNKQYNIDNKEIIKINQHQYYEDNKETILEKNKQYREDNLEYILAQNKQYRVDNREKILKQKQESYEKNKETYIKYAQDNKEIIKIKRRKRYNDNKEKYLKKSKEYKENNIEKIRTTRNKWEKKRRQEDPLYAIKQSMATLINQRIKKLGIKKKNKSARNSFPWTDEELNIRFELLFSHPDNLGPNGEKWMNWNNKGRYNSKTFDPNNCSTWTWQIDHINPQYNYDYKEIGDAIFNECFSINNLRPLRSDINVKNNKYRTNEEIDRIKKSIQDFLILEDA